MQPQHSNHVGSTGFDRRSDRRAFLVGVAAIGLGTLAGTAAPSASDTAEASPDLIYLIVGLHPEPAVAVWRLVDGNFAAVSLVRT